MPIPEPASVASKVLISLGKSLAQGILKRARSKLAESLSTPEAQEALERCGRAAVAALVERGYAGGAPGDLRDHLEEVLGGFAKDGDAHAILEEAVRRGRLPEDEVKELESRFREVHAPEETLRGFDVERGVAAFVDSGNAFDRFHVDPKTGIGLGIRWRSPVGPIRLDLAHPLDKHGDLVRVHFVMGPEL